MEDRELARHWPWQVETLGNLCEETSDSKLEESEVN